MGFGLILALILAEGALQIGARFVSGSANRVLRTATGAKPRILCVGDSNTYGLHLPPPSSYPGQLQQVLGDSVEVLNLGYPGTNSFRLRNSLPGLLDELRPDLVLVLIGANDFWTTPSSIEDDGEPSLDEWMMRWSRVYKLLAILGRSSMVPGFRIEMPAAPEQAKVDREGGEDRVSIGESEVAFGWEPKQSGYKDWMETYPANVAAIAATVANHGASMQLLTYASQLPIYRVTSQLIRKTGASLNLPVIDVAPRFREICPQVECPEFLFADGHPNARGYTEYAQVVAEKLDAGGE